MKNNLIRYFQGLSLRQRFLVAPLLGLVVCSLVTAAFIYESQRQNALLSRITEQDLTAFNHYAEVFVNLTEHHTALYDLLYSAGKSDEATLYDQSKQHLYKVQQAVDDLEQALPLIGKSAAPGLAALRNELSANAQAYLKGFGAAVEMATLDVSLAPDQLARANKRFTAMNRSFVKLLDSERRGISSEIAARVRQSQISSTTIALVGVSIVLLLAFLSQVLSRILSRSIETQVGILTDLGAQAGARLAVEGSDEVERMTHAIGAFRQSLLDLRHSRDELEQRVLERTLALTQAIDELRSEVMLRKEAEQQLEKLAFHDSLTGLPNRALFRDRLNIGLADAARHKTMLAAMYLDLDRFKYVNDLLGHAAGDMLLIEISQRIGCCLRSSDTLARMGGDEFTVVLRDCRAQADVVLVAERIIGAAAKVVQLGEESARVGASIGISCFPQDGRDAETIQQNADLAMYEAKQAGRGQYRFFSPEMRARGNKRRSLGAQIDAA